MYPQISIVFYTIAAKNRNKILNITCSQDMWAVRRLCGGLCTGVYGDCDIFGGQLRGAVFAVDSSLPQLCPCSGQTHTPAAHQPFLACTSTGELWMWPFCIAQRERRHLCAAEDAACARICVWESTTHIFICLQVCKRLWMDEFVIVTYENVCWTSGWTLPLSAYWNEHKHPSPARSPPRPSYFPALEGDTV